MKTGAWWISAADGSRVKDSTLRAMIADGTCRVEWEAAGEIGIAWRPFDALDGSVDAFYREPEGTPHLH